MSTESKTCCCRPNPAGCVPSFLASAATLSPFQGLSPGPPGLLQKACRLRALWWAQCHVTVDPRQSGDVPKEAPLLTAGCFPFPDTPSLFHSRTWFPRRRSWGVGTSPGTSAPLEGKGSLQGTEGGCHSWGATRPGRGLSLKPLEEDRSECIK